MEPLQANSLIFQNTSSYWDRCLGKTITFNATPGDLTVTGQAYALIGAAWVGTTSVSEVVSAKLHSSSPAPV